MNKANIHITMNRLSQAIGEYGVRIIPYSSANSQVVAKISDSQIFQANRVLASYLEVISAHIDPDKKLPPLDRDKTHLDRFLERYKLKISNRFKDQLKDGDLLEVYALNHQQIFRNVDFFRICNYDLETMVFIPWTELFSRDIIVQSTIFEILNAVIEQKIPFIDNPPIPKHVLQECYGEHQARFSYRMKHAACVFDKDSNESMGYATILSVKPMSGPQSI